MKNEQKIMPYAQGAFGCSFLIPKRRGRGFKKQPVGHHASELSTLLGEWGANRNCGLEGVLEIDDDGANADYYAQKLAEHYGFKPHKCRHSVLYDYVLGKITLEELLQE